MKISLFKALFLKIFPVFRVFPADKIRKITQFTPKQAKKKRNQKLGCAKFLPLKGGWRRQHHNAHLTCYVLMCVNYAKLAPLWQAFFVQCNIKNGLKITKSNKIKDLQHEKKRKIFSSQRKKSDFCRKISTIFKNFSKKINLKFMRNK